jgi:hypothetical protein
MLRSLSHSQLLFEFWVGLVHPILFQIVVDCHHQGRPRWIPNFWCYSAARSAKRMNAGPGSQAVFVVTSSSNTNGSSNYGLCCRSRQGFLVVKCMKIIKRRCNSQKSPIKINSDVLVILQKCNCQFGSLFTLHIYKLLTLKVKHLPRLPFFLGSCR